MRVRKTISNFWRMIKLTNHELDKFGVYIWTSNSLMHCCPAWAYLFNKFWPWPQKVKILGYNNPDFDLPQNFEYISLGVQRGPKFWSDDMIDYFSSNEDHEVFYLTTEDGFLVHPVNSGILNLATRIAFDNIDEKFMRFNLTSDIQSRPHELVAGSPYGEYDLIKASQRSIYRQSLQHSIWRRDSFLKKLIPGQSPWDFELDNARAINDGLDVYATKRKYGIHCGHGYMRGKKIKNWYADAHDHEGIGLSKEDIDFIEDNNWMPEI